MKELSRAGVLALTLLSTICIGAQSAPPAQPASPQTGELTMITIPAGTKVLLATTTSLNTISATNESSLYLETVSDVIEQNRLVVPVGSRVQGSVIKTGRPGRIKGRANLQFHFDRVILPNNYVVPVSGRLVSLAGSEYETKRSGTLQPVDQIDKDAKTILTSVGTSAGIGALAGGGRGAWQGAAIGAAFGIGIAMFKRGDDIHLMTGTRMEMILEHDVSIPSSKLDFRSKTEPKNLPPEPWYPHH
ncbi:MAG TPA: hypothetical protein VFU50_04245 [Terriglobales bacterium]|nr:hypothetical protein [Terriglobales bacterium]